MFLRSSKKLSTPHDTLYAYHCQLPAIVVLSLALVLLLFQH